MTEDANRRMSKQDWLLLGLDVLECQGLGGLRVERLCKSAGKTRGSFYHHFVDHNAFIISLLEHWQKNSTDRIIELAGKFSDPREQRKALVQQVVELSPILETSIRGWSESDQRARAVLRKVDDARLKFLRKGIGALAREAGVELSNSEVSELAILNYGLFIGVHALKPDTSRNYYLKISELSEAMLESWLEKKAAR
ncbi:MAG: TetR/AcrR family transcriptional regulator [Rhizobiaceae bacterium]|nr:TetR/AcrR family transcriptional regulator [Rhizobiaceae bacterium]